MFTVAILLGRMLISGSLLINTPVKLSTDSKNRSSVIETVTQSSSMPVDGLNDSSCVVDVKSDMAPNSEGKNNDN